MKTIVVNVRISMLQYFAKRRQSVFRFLHVGRSKAATCQRVGQGQESASIFSSVLSDVYNEILSLKP